MKRPLPAVRMIPKKRVLLVRLLDHPELIRDRVPLLRRQALQSPRIDPQAASHSASSGSIGHHSKIGQPSTSPI